MCRHAECIETAMAIMTLPVYTEGGGGAHVLTFSLVDWTHKESLELLEVIDTVSSV
jgi:hypothetical protein